MTVRILLAGCRLKNLAVTHARKLKKAALANTQTLAELVVNGDCDAPEALLRIAYTATRELTKLCKSRPELFEPLARNEFSWPVEHSLHDDWMKGNNALLAKLNLAADTEINITGKRRRRFSFPIPANKIAIELHFVANALRRASMDWESVEWIKDWWTGVPWTAVPVRGNPFTDDPRRLRALERWGKKGPSRFLPPLSKATAEQWKNAVPELFRLVYGAKFDGHPHLKDLRQSVFRSAKDNYDRVGGAGVVRKRMLQAVVQAFGAIAACNK